MAPPVPGATADNRAFREADLNLALQDHTNKRNTRHCNCLTHAQRILFVKIQVKTLWIRDISTTRRNGRKRNSGHHRVRYSLSHPLADRRELIAGSNSAGVIGLSVALRIQRHLKPSQSVLLVARDFPNTTSINYATPWAGAHYRPVPGDSPQLKQEAAWAKYTYETFRRIAAEDPAAGVQFLTGEEYFEDPPPEYVAAAADVSGSLYGHLSDSFKVLTSDEIGDEAVRLCIRYDTYCVNSPVYVASLLRRFVLNGGSTREYTLVALKEAFGLEENVTTAVNCSGMGLGDPKSFIIRGLYPFQ